MATLEIQSLRMKSVKHRSQEHPSEKYLAYPPELTWTIHCKRQVSSICVCPPMLLDVLRPLQLCAKSREQHLPSCFEIAKGIHCPCGSAGSPNFGLYTPRSALAPGAHLKAQRRSVPAQISRRLIHSDNCHAAIPCLWFVLLHFSAGGSGEASSIDFAGRRLPVLGVQNRALRCILGDISCICCKRRYMLRFRNLCKCLMHFDTFALF